MTDPWTKIATLLATVIEKYGAEILSEEEPEHAEPTEDARTFAKESDS